MLLILLEKPVFVSGALSRLVSIKLLSVGVGEHFGQNTSCSVRHFCILIIQQCDVDGVSSKR